MENEHQSSDIPHDAHDDLHAHGSAISRRTLLILGGTALAAAAIPGTLFLQEPAGSGIVAADFVALLEDKDGAAMLGRRWIEEGGAQESAIVHEKRLEKRMRAEGWVPGMGVEDTRAALSSAVRADYLAARTISIADWHLSQTEGSLCVLAALAAKQEHG